MSENEVLHIELAERTTVNLVAVLSEEILIAHKHEIMRIPAAATDLEARVAAIRRSRITIDGVKSGTQQFPFKREPTEVQGKLSQPLPAPAELPATKIDLRELEQHKKDWPKQVTLNQAVAFPLFLDGKEIGSTEVTKGTTLSLVAVHGDQIQVTHASLGITKTIPAAATDLEVRVAAIRRSRITIDGVTYEDVTFGEVTATDVTIRHKSGTEKIPFEKLPIEVQKNFAQLRQEHLKGTIAYLDAENGFRGFRFGGVITESQDMKLEESSNDQQCYSRKGDLLVFNSLPVKRINYLCYKGIFEGALVTMEDTVDVAAMKRILVATYGQPKLSTRQLCAWKGDRVELCFQISGTDPATVIITSPTVQAWKDESRTLEAENRAAEKRPMKMKAYAEMNLGLDFINGMFRGKKLSTISFDGLTEMLGPPDNAWGASNGTFKCAEYPSKGLRVKYFYRPREKTGYFIISVYLFNGKYFNDKAVFSAFTGTLNEGVTGRWKLSKFKEVFDAFIVQSESEDDLPVVVGAHGATQVYFDSTTGFLQRLDVVVIGVSSD